MVSEVLISSTEMNNPFSLLIFILVSFSNFSATVLAQDKLPPPKNGDVYVIAHRGEHNGIPENSIAAYQKAIDLGCDFVEIDVRTTKDNKFVSVHNSTIDAYVIGKTGKVRDLTLAELRALDIGEKIGTEWKNTRIPTFEEILKLCQGKIGIYLDLKNADPAALIEIINSYNMEEQIVWYVSAAAHKTLMEIKQNCPTCLIMPDPGREQNIEKVAVAYQPKVMATDMSQLSKSFVEKAHLKNAMVFVDDSENDLGKLEMEWEKIINWKTDAIQTDQPEALIRYLRQR
jgi:glycerophosphoryl diester phosphodiesterase